MKKKILFGFFSIVLIAVNFVFSFQNNQGAICVSQLLKLPQASAEWPITDTGLKCSTLSSSRTSGSGCVTYITIFYSCSSGLDGTCSSGSIQNKMDCHGNVSNVSRDVSVITCGI